jgi:hypothetical protein
LTLFLPCGFPTNFWGSTISGCQVMAMSPYKCAWWCESKSRKVTPRHGWYWAPNSFSVI